MITRGRHDSSDPWTTDEREADWRAGHRELLQGVRHAEHWTAHRSGHAILFDEPAVLLRAIRKVTHSVECPAPHG